MRMRVFEIAQRTLQIAQTDKFRAAIVLHSHVSRAATITAYINYRRSALCILINISLLTGWNGTWNKKSLSGRIFAVLSLVVTNRKNIGSVV